MENKKNGESSEQIEGRSKTQNFVLLKGKIGNVFWTTDDGSDHEGFVVLHKGTSAEEMVKKWQEHHFPFYQ